MQLTKSRLFLAAHGVQLDNGVDPPVQVLSYIIEIWMKFMPIIETKFGILSWIIKNWAENRLVSDRFL